MDREESTYMDIYGRRGRLRLTHLRLNRDITHPTGCVMADFLDLTAAPHAPSLRRRVPRHFPSPLQTIGSVAGASPWQLRAFNVAECGRKWE